MQAIVTIEWSTGHYERYSFANKQVADRFLRIIYDSVQYPGCQENLASWMTPTSLMFRETHLSGLNAAWIMNDAAKLRVIIFKEDMLKEEAESLGGVEI